MSIAPVIALIGSPNSGKTSVFNWLTGSRFKTVNYAGSTVEVHQGQSLPFYGEPLLNVLDTPGVYSLIPHGPDEQVTLDTLITNPAIKGVIVVLDATQLGRQLYLIRQIQALNFPLVACVTMVDLSEKAGLKIDLNRLSELIHAPVIGVDGRLGGGLKELIHKSRLLTESETSDLALHRKALNWQANQVAEQIQTARGWAKQVVGESSTRNSLHRLRRWDKLFLHPIWGFVIFACIMSSLFTSIFWAAAPLMDLIDQMAGFSATATHSQLGDNLASDFLAHGLIAGVGSVLVFVPQIFILFFGFSLLEDSGYLARAATIVDRPLQFLGLSGRSFVPLLSGFACAVPAILASRNIRSSRERWIAVFIIPFMTCSARLPVYALLLTFLFFGDQAWKAGIAMTGLYLGGIVLGALAARALNVILPKSKEAPFLMELPVYRLPKLTFTLKIALRRTQTYVFKAGPTILAFVLVLWIGTHIPYRPEVSKAEQLSSSLVGQIGQMIEPVFYPMGLDWRAGLGILSAFVAREVFVSSMAVIFNLTDVSDDSLTDSLLLQMRQATRADQQILFTPASVSALIVFFMVALQCLSTTAITWREMGSWKYAFGQLVVLNSLAYVLAVGVYAAMS